MQRLLNFDVSIQPRGGGYYTCIATSSAGEAHVDFALPFSDQDLQILVLQVLASVGRSRRKTRRIQSQERQLLEDFGGQLFQAVFSGAVRNFLDRSLAAAESKKVGLRIRLRLPPELANIPWEYLYDRESAGFVSLSPETALVRYVDMPRPPQPFPISPPLRILAMISAPSDVPELQGDDEWDKLNAALTDLTGRGMVQVDRLDRATLAALQRPLRGREYHILHFVGHGMYDEDAQDGALALEAGDGRTRLVTGRDLGMMLKGHPSLRLVVLNACEGARSAPDDPFGGVAQALVRQGIPAVIAMQFEISDPAALVFSQSFYQAIADGLPVDLAMVQARLAMFAEGNEVEWGTPVLYLRSPDGQVFIKGRTPKADLQAREEAEQEARDEADRQAKQQATVPAETTVRLGAWKARDGKGTDFAVFSESGDGVDLCLIDEDGNEQRRVALSSLRSTDGAWHVHVSGVGAGQRYGYRVKGRYEPGSGYRSNENKLLLDPYARAIEGVVDWDASVFGYVPGADPPTADQRDSARHVPRSVVVDDVFDWRDDRHPNIPWADTVIYDVHVRGFTMQHPGIPSEGGQRGSYAAMGSAPVINYLKDLGVTTLQLMSVHHFVSEQALVHRGLTNYWGYNPIGYFAPEGRYSSSGTAGEQVQEFKAMVRSLHAAKLEVILDVVFNHTAEGNQLGPHLCFRGIDNRSYYLLEKDQSKYTDYSRCGNSLNLGHPQVLALIMASLRYWVEEMHVDGFRFDLASALARNLHATRSLPTFFGLIRDDPVISQVKLIAESWDVGEHGGYEVDNFPVMWGEFNDHYRDALRQFWRGTRQPRKELARRLTGSVDRCRSDGRSPVTSINFVTCHDGFTLHDLVSYNRKHNEANGEDNLDGVKSNYSWNCGDEDDEGPTRSSEVLALRERQKRNFLVTLLLSAGVPMLLAGDEIGRTQQGNNNPYCQDNEISWVDWQLDERREALLQFTRQLIALRAAHPVFRRRRAFEGQEITDDGMKDIGWFSPDGTEMDEAKWRDPDVCVLGMFLNGQAVFDRAMSGERIPDDSFLMLLNGGNEPRQFTLPGPAWATQYEPIIDTSIDPASASDAASRALKAGDAIQLDTRSVVVLRATTQPSE